LKIKKFFFQKNFFKEKLAEVEKRLEIELNLKSEIERVDILEKELANVKEQLEEEREKSERELRCLKFK